jgi:hypothetical protein
LLDREEVSEIQKHLFGAPRLTARGRLFRRSSTLRVVVVWVGRGTI